MKISKAYYGETSFGVSIEKVVSICGVWFIRECLFNVYGHGWTKWEQCEPMTFEVEYENKYNGEIYKYKKPQAFCGFSKMTQYENLPRYRLPKICVSV